MVRIRSPQYFINIFTNEYFVCPFSNFLLHTSLFLPSGSLCSLSEQPPSHPDEPTFPLQCMGHLIALVLFCLERLVGCCRSKLVVIY